MEGSSTKSSAKAISLRRNSSTRRTDDASTTTATGFETASQPGRAKKRGIPKWIWASCGCGCLAVVILVAISAFWLKGVVEEGTDPEIQWPKLQKVLPYEERPADLAEIRGIIYTPTFVLVDDGEEVGRITGYAGEEFFWGLLGIELKKLDDGAATVTRLSRTPGASLHQQGEDK